MSNFPGPFELRLNYACTVGTVTYQHQHRVSMNMETEGDPGDPFSAWQALLPDGVSGFALDEVVDDYLAVVDDLFPAATDFVDVELWEYEVGTLNAAFRSVYSLGLNGTGGGSSQADAQTIVSFRSTLGGIAKLDFRDTLLAAATFQTFPTSVTSINALAAYVVSSLCPFVARDNGYLFSPYKYLPGTNERSFKKRLR